MARSFRKVGIVGNTTAGSEKGDKARANRRLRRLTRIAVQNGAVVLPLLREVSDVWNFAKDGKTYRGDGGALLRK